MQVVARRRLTLVDLRIVKKVYLYPFVESRQMGLDRVMRENGYANDVVSCRQMLMGSVDKLWPGHSRTSKSSF